MGFRAQGRSEDSKCKGITKSMPFVQYFENTADTPLPSVHVADPKLVLLHKQLGTPVVPFFPFYFGVSLLKLNSRKKGTLIIMRLLGNLDEVGYIFSRSFFPGEEDFSYQSALVEAKSGGFLVGAE